jgi:hypothetical protein
MQRNDPEFKPYVGHPRLRAIHRPFFNESARQLAAVAEASWSDPETLEMIAWELRNYEPAAALAHKISTTQ